MGVGVRQKKSLVKIKGDPGGGGGTQAKTESCESNMPVGPSLHWFVKERTTG